ncbi:MAG: hypothetical protein AAGK93_04095 [Pseudomonadota bacterium]
MLKMLGGQVGTYLITILVTAAFVGGPTAYVAHNFGYGKATKKFERERSMFFSREIALWHELGASRVSNIDLIDSIETMWDVTGEARRQMQRALAAQREKARISSEAAAAAIKRLDYVESTWKDVVLPDAIVGLPCLPDATTNCTGPGAGPGVQDGVEVREPAAGNQ